MRTALTLAAVMATIAGGYAWWAVHAIIAGAPVWPYVVGCLVAYHAIPFGAAVLWFGLAARFGSPVPREFRIDLRQRWALFWDEVRAIARSGPRMVLFRWLTRDPPPTAAEVPVLLLHGVLCNAGVWYGLRRHLARSGIGPVYTLSYGPPLASIELFARQLAARIDAVLAATGARQLVIVGHSMGGLVARAYLRDHGGDRVRLLLTLGTPHHGSMHAHLFPGVCLGQMRPGNGWLTALNADESGCLPCPVVSLWSWHDSMVAPQLSSRLAGAREIAISGVGHNALLSDRRVRAAVVTELVGAGVAANARGEAAAQRVVA